MKTADAIRTAGVQPVAARVNCPECEAEIVMQERQLIEGNLIRCEHCGTTSELTRELVEHSDACIWALINPALENDDDHR